MESFSQSLRAALPTGCTPPPESADARLDLFAQVSAVYAAHLRRRPHDWVWLESPEAARDWGARDFSELLRAATAGAEADSPAWYAALRRYRRRMLLRIAYRDIALNADIERVFAEQTLLAECVLRAVLDAVMKTWIQRLGAPWDSAENSPARWCALALGKFGAGELNFYSDLDLIFFFEGEGACRRADGAAGVGNAEFFERAFRDACGKLQQADDCGALYKIDLRLRPDGDTSPLARSASGLLDYYWSRGQTWERLAWIRARAVAGDLALGDELLEEMNAFRYPRAASPSLLREVAGVKLRTEREVVGAGMLARDIKSGTGGIREIEFFAQAHQLLDGGRNPFLQTLSTRKALDRLARYGFVDEKTRAFLWGAYAFLRRAENRLQQRDERRTHVLPPEGDPWVGALARSLGFENPEVFLEKMRAVRARVREIYSGYFGDDEGESLLQEWVAFLGGAAPSAAVAARLQECFGDAPDRDARVRSFALGGGCHALTREQVMLFLGLADAFGRIGDKLSRPLRALERLGSFADRYGARTQFFKVCVGSPDIFDALCLVFDRSEFIHALLCRHPEILEELLHTSRNRNKTPADLSAEIARLPRGADFPRYLWLYVKAEQVRLAIAQALYDWPREEVEQQLSRLADAALSAALEIAEPAGGLAVVALGKYGGEESGFGSDLDLLLLARSDGADAARCAAEFCKILSYAEPLGKTYEIDLRLRPYGNDGPTTTTLAALRRYHAAGGDARAWERQVLVRARFVCGDAALGAEFFKWRDVLLADPVSPEFLAQLWRARLHAEAEKTRGVKPPERAFKAAAGGLMDLEFLAQMLQLRAGALAPQLRSPNTAETLEAASETFGEQCGCYLRFPEDYAYLRSVEMTLRRDSQTGIAVLPEGGRELFGLARMLGYRDGEAFMEAHVARLRRIRADVERALRHIGLPDAPQS